MNLYQPCPSEPDTGRRSFLTSLLTFAGAAAFANPSSLLFADRTGKAAVTVQDVIDLILSHIPSAPFTQTVDTIKWGDSSQKVSGIVTTMFSTAAVIERAAALGANFIIAHEPTFYNHADEQSWLQHDSVYQYKTAMLKKHKMVVWRFHDYIHAHRPDGVLTGVLQALGWQQYSNADNPRMLTIPPTSLSQIISHVKEKLGIHQLRYVGDDAAACQRILLMPGAAGGRRQIEAISKEKPDLVIVGEVSEWETSEYIRDLQHSQLKTSLIVLGHVVSEEPGLEWLKTWLQPQLPGIAITHIPTTDVFKWR